MVNNRILLVYVNPINFPPVQPKGIEILASFLIENDFIVDIVSPFQESFFPFKLLEQYLLKHKYLFVGLSFRNFDNAGFHFNNSSPTNYFTFLAKIVKKLKRSKSSLPILLGGSGFSIDPVNQLKKLGLSFGINGAGEQSIVEFAKSCKSVNTRLELEEQIKTKIKHRKIPGFIIIDSQNTISISAEKKNYIESKNNYINREWLYASKLIGGMIPIRTKIGCLRKCNYCVVPLYDNFLIRKNSAILKEIQDYRKLNDHYRFFFADSEINFPNNIWLKDLLEEIIQKFGANEIGWEGYLYPIIKDFEKLAPFIKKSGCNQINLTVDALDNDILKKMGKDYSVEEVMQLINILKSHQINTRMNILFGSIGESDKTIKRQLNVIKSLSKKGIKATINVGLRVYPNTKLSEDVLKYKKHTNKSIKSQTFCSPNSYNNLGRFLLKELRNVSNVSFTEERDMRHERYCKYLFIGAINLERKQFKKSESAFKKALLFNIEAYRPKLGLARNYYECGKIDKANFLLHQLEK